MCSVDRYRQEYELDVINLDNLFTNKDVFSSRETQVIETLCTQSYVTLQ